MGEKLTTENKERIQVLKTLSDEFKRRDKELRGLAEKYIKRALAYAIVQSLSKKRNHDNHRTHNRFLPLPRRDKPGLLAQSVRAGHS